MKWPSSLRDGAEGRTLMFMLRIAALLLALHASAAFAADVWMALARPEAAIGTLAVAVDPFDTNILYATSGHDRLVKSTDGGRTWSFLPLRGDFLQKIILEAPDHLTVVDWRDPNYAVHRSTDGGMSWITWKFDSPHRGYLDDIAVDPANPNVLYGALERLCAFSCMADSGGLMKSTDGGRRWSTVFRAISMERVLVDPFGSGTVYAFGEIARRSDDGGATWTTLDDLNGQRILHMAFDPLVPGRLYAGTIDNFWRSDDRGDHWQKLGQPFRAIGIASIAVDATRPNVIVAAGSNGWGAKRSKDGGETWEPLNEGLSHIYAPQQLAGVTDLQFVNGKLYAASSNGAITLNEAVSGPRRRSIRH